MPTAKTKDNSKPAGVDIRGFFKASGSQPTPSSSFSSKKKDIIVIDEDESTASVISSHPLEFRSSTPSGPSQEPRGVVSTAKPNGNVVASKPQASSSTKRKAAAVEDVNDSEEDAKPSPPKKKAPAASTKDSKHQSSSTTNIDSASNGKPSPRKEDAASRRASSLKRKSIVISSDEENPAPKPPKKPKRKSALLSSESEEEPTTPKNQKSANGTAKAERVPKAVWKSKAKKEESSDSEDEVALLPKKGASSIKDTGKKAQKLADGKVKVKEEAAEQPKKKFDWVAARAAKATGPSNPGSKEVPEGVADCLLGLSFVFTGELSSFSRDEAVDIAKRFGGRVVGQPSSKTDYVVLGDNAGPSKLAAIKKHGLHTLNEDEFLNLIATRKGPGGKDGKLDDKTKKKMQKEEEAIKIAAKEMEKREKALAKEAKEVASTGSASTKTIDPSTQLWTTRYAPQALRDVCGNKDKIEKLQQWLLDWPASLKGGFKKPGKYAMNQNRAVLITGTPGIGKTTSAHLCAKLAGFTPIELNASDARSKKLVENGMNINNKSLDGYIAGAGSTNDAGITITDRTCLIMDEVDGMSAGDRGGVGALNALIKKSRVPIICIANDRNAQKLKPLAATTFALNFSKPPATAIRSRIMTIAFKEKMKIPANVVDQLVAGSQSDIRQVLNMLSTWKLSSDTMDFDEGKELAKANEKYTIMSPFDITSKVLGPYLFSSTARETLGEKMELYFQDHSFVPLFIQENYLKTQPSRVRNIDGPEKELRLLQLMDKAASSLSDGDLVDGMIHGSEQHWSLMPLHAVCSTIRPASFVYGQGAHYGGSGGMSFPQWLGQNSKQNKLSRQLGDVQTRMRLKVSGDKHEIRQSYIPALFPSLVKPLIDVGATEVDNVIGRMDDYFLSKEDWDTIVELGVGDNKDEVTLKKISTGVKTSFTKKYNSSEHPIPFHKAQDLGKVPKKLTISGPAPDIEDAFDLDEAVEDASDDEKKNKSNEDDITKDKLIAAPKKKKAAKK